MGRRVQGTDIIFLGGPAGEFGRGLRRLWRRGPFSTGALLRIMGGKDVRSPGALERYLKEESSRNRASMSMCALLRRPRTVGVAVTGDPEEYVEEGSVVCHLFPWGLHWGTWKGARLPGNMMDDTGVSVGSPLGNVERGSDYHELWELTEGGLWL